MCVSLLSSDAVLMREQFSVVEYGREEGNATRESNKQPKVLP